MSAIMRVLIAALSCALVYAQSPTATVVGAVRDALGASVPGASFEIRNIGTNEIRKVEADAQGEFTIANLSAGMYEATVTHTGFRKIHEKGIELQIDQVARFDFKLEVGSVTESLEVTASAPLLNTENAVKGEVMVSAEIAETPLNGRDFTELALLVPGVAPKAQGGQGSGFAINGQRADNTNFVLDGFNDQNPRGAAAQARPNIDALQEFKMQTSGYSAESGRLAGGVMNMVIKSGTNEFHGVVFEFLRNDIWDARNFFADAKSPLHRNQFGGTVGGPVRIPKLYDGRNKTFFLFSWESYRQTTGATQLARVPTLLERAGNFAGAGVLKDPKGGNFPGAIVPASRMSPQALKANAFNRLPNREGVNNLFAVAADRDQWDSPLMKFDHHFNNSNILSYRYTKRYNRITTPFSGSAQPGFALLDGSHQSLMGLTYTHMFSPSIINEARIGLSRTATHDRGQNQGRDYAAEFGIRGVTTDPALIGLPRFTVTGLAAIGDANSLPADFAVNNIQSGDTLTWVKGKHLVKMGGDILRIQLFEPYLNNNRGTFNFLGRWTNQPYADFLLGLPESASRQVGSSPNYLFSTNYGFFAQDDIKLASRFTLNLGIRYEIPKPPNEKYGRITNFIPELGLLVLADDSTLKGSGTSFTDAGKVGVARNLGLPDSLVYTRYGDIAPRVGFAWRPFGGNRAVVRGGYGIFYGNEVINPIRNSLANVFPFVISQTVTRKANDSSYLTLANPFPVAPTLTSGVTNVNGFDLHAPTPYTQSWNLTAEREIGLGSALEIAYVGAKGTHLGREYDINQPIRSAALAPNFPRPYPLFGTMNYYAFGANSIYNAGTLSLRRRFSGGFFFRMNYTYSKSIDDASQLSGSSAGGVGAPQNSRDLRAERGRSDWDRGHVFTMNFSYAIPVRGHALLRGWQLAGTGRLYSGPPFTPLTSNVNLALGDASRPDRVAKGPASDPGPDRWFDVKAFPVVSNGSFRFGNSGRNILDAPGLQEFNLTLFKNFALTERISAQFRGEAFNAFNHANFGIPNRNVNEPAAATIAMAGTPRLMQFGLKLYF